MRLTNLFDQEYVKPTPQAGDIFEFELDDDTVIETTIAGVDRDGNIELYLDETAINMIEQRGMLTEHIVKVKGGYELKSKHGNKNLGKYPTKAGAEKRERQVQYFKHAGESVEEAAPTAVRWGAGAAVGALAGTGGTIIGSMLGGIFAPLVGGYSAWNGTKLGMQAADEIWDWAAKKLGGSEHDFAMNHVRAAAQGADTFKFKGKEFPVTLPKTDVNKAVQAIKSVAESQIGGWGTSTSSSNITPDLRGVHIPGNLKHPEWKEPTWSFSEVAEKLGISPKELQRLALKLGNFPKKSEGLRSQYGSKAYYPRSEIKRWVNATNIRDIIKSGLSTVAEASGSGYTYKDTDEGTYITNTMGETLCVPDVSLQDQGFKQGDRRLPEVWQMNLEMSNETGAYIVDDEEGVTEGSGSKNIGSRIKQVYKKIYNMGDDAIEFAYYDSPIFAQYWDEYEGDLDSIVAEVDPKELQIIYDELESALENQGLDEAKYHGKEVSLGKPVRGGPKKFYVYVRDPSTKNIKKVNFGDPNMRIKKNSPKHRKSFRARHNCANPGPRTKARYWSCRKW